MWVYSIREVIKRLSVSRPAALVAAVVLIILTARHAQAQKPPPSAQPVGQQAATSAGTGSTAPKPEVAPAALSSEYAAELGEIIEGNTSSARRLFKEGVIEADRGRWQQAAELFRQSLSLRPSPVTTYNLASAYGKLGRIVEASELLRSVIWDPAATQTVREVAKALLDALMPQVGWLTIRVEGDPSLVALTLDSRPLTLQRLGIALPMDPGRHVLAVQRACSFLDTRLIDLPPGAVRQEVVSYSSLRMPELTASAPTGAEQSRNPLAASPVRKSKLLSSPWFWIAPGVLVAGAVVAAVLWTSVSK